MLHLNKIYKISSPYVMVNNNKNFLEKQQYQIIINHHIIQLISYQIKRIIIRLILHLQIIIIITTQIIININQNTVIFHLKRKAI